MGRVYIFDVDGTLTPSRRTMTEDFLEFFNGWSKRNSFWLVSGSDLDKMKEQVPEYILERAEGIFTCGGNQMWREGSSRQWPTEWLLKYENKFTPPQNLLTYLGDRVRMSETPIMATKHIEDRGSMLNFSVVGRDCSLEERAKYFEWDKQVREREIIANEVKRRWPELDAVIGGQISIDIAPIGNDKSQVIGKIMDYQPNREYIFIGDMTIECGNDYPLAKVMNELDECVVYQAGTPSAEDGYKTTQKILEELND